MVASILILVFSLVLLIYWFRYSCMLLLEKNQELASSVRTIPDARFSFTEVQERLAGEAELAPLHASLRRDYQLLIYLVEHASRLELESFEDRLLVWDYKVMQWWYGLTRIAFPSQARHALAEMAAVIALLARRVSDQAGVQSPA